jgi:23S rRNA (uracil1939-C5)-methyltransferase
MTTTLKIRIDGLAFGGDGIGRHEGQVVFVPGAVTGDVLRVRVVQHNRRFLRAQVIQILEPGPSRVVPPCPVYPQCGGCQWQHIDYSSQFAAKVQIVRQALLPENAWQAGSPILREHPAPLQFRYRRRARLAFTVDKVVHAGLLARRSNVIVDTQSCAQFVPALQTAFGHIRELLAQLSHARGELELLANDAGEVHSSIQLRTPMPDSIDAIWGARTDHCRGLLITDHRKSRHFGEESIKLDARGLDVNAACFAQANAAQDEVLRRIVLEHLQRIDTKRVLEFHAGVGNFTVDMARAGIDVTAIESHPLAVVFLRGNVAGLNVETLQVDAESHIWKNTPDCIFLDPPREGAPELCKRIAASKVRQVIHVSCDPMTLTRDVRVLQGAGFRLDAVHVIDMMPHTYHIEAVCVLSRR